MAGFEGRRWEVRDTEEVADVWDATLGEEESCWVCVCGELRAAERRDSGVKPVPES